MEYICTNKEENYYASYDFSPEFYVSLCKKGFIATSCNDIKNEQILLPEMQFEYAILHFENLHISQKVKSLLKKEAFVFSKNAYFEEVLDKLEKYHKNSWLFGKYKTMLEELNQQHFENFELVTFELLDKENQYLVAGEIGYIIGKTYTSLSGFCSKEKHYNNWGKLQLVLLSHHLQQHQFSFWNLGHACLKYKLDLGAKVYAREDFLKLWNQHIIE